MADSIAHVYIRIGDHRIFAKNLKTQAVFDEPALVAFLRRDNKRRVVALGQPAVDFSTETGAEKVSPFEGHPRVVIGDVEGAAALLEHAFRSVWRGWSFLPPIAAIHLAKRVVGGLAAIEMRCFAEIIEKAGARPLIVPHETVEKMTNAEIEESLSSLAAFKKRIPGYS